MTTTFRRRSPVADFRSPAVFWPVFTVTLGVTAIAATTSPPSWLSAAVVLTVIAVLGIPHGAVDHLVIEEIDDRHDVASRRRFLGRYLSAMAAIGVVWLAVPVLALATFITVSVHHFGQSDLAYLRLPRRRQLLLQWSRGLFLVGLPLVAHLERVSPLIEQLGGGSPASWPWLADRWWLWCAVLVGQHVAAGAAVAAGSQDRTTIGREAITVVALTALFLGSDPLIGFAVYFGLWHSLAHLLVLAGLLGTGTQPVRAVARLAAPLTAVSLFGLGVVAGGAALIGRPELLLPVAFVFVSMLTLPHMIVVERVWRNESPTSR